MTANLLALIAARKASVSRAKALQPNPGRNRYRILPSWRGADQQFWLDFGQHFIKDSAGQVKAVVVCQDKTYGRPCPVCEAVGLGIKMSRDDLTKKRLEEAKASSRVLLNVLALDTPNPTEPQVLAVAPTVFNGFGGAGGIISVFPDYPDLLDPAKGSDIIIEKSGSGMQTRYGVTVVPGKPYDPKILERLHNLDEWVKAAEGDISRALSNVSALTGLLPAPGAGKPSLATFNPEDVVDVDESPAPAPAAAAPAPKPAPAPAAPAPAAPAPAAATADATDDELNKILNDLE